MLWKPIRLMLTYHFLIWTLAAGRRLMSRSGLFTARKNTRYPQLGGWVSLRIALVDGGGEKNSQSFYEKWALIIYSIARHFTNWAITARNLKGVPGKSMHSEIHATVTKFFFTLCQLQIPSVLKLRRKKSTASTLLILQRPYPSCGLICRERGYLSYKISVYGI